MQNRYIIGFSKPGATDTIFERFVTKSRRYSKVIEQLNTALHKKYGFHLDQLENLQIYHEKVL